MHDDNMIMYNNLLYISICIILLMNLLLNSHIAQAPNKKRIWWGCGVKRHYVGSIII